MGFTVTYRSLFSLDCWHHFFLDDETGNFMGLNTDRREKILQRYLLDDFLNIRPTKGTLRIMKGHQLIFKKTPSGFVIASKTDPFDVSKIFNPLAENQILRFTISTSKSSFHNYTNGQHQNRGLYYFNNYNHPDNDFPGLSQWPSVFDPTLAGTMEGDGDPNTFAYRSGAMLVDTLPGPKVLKLAREGTNINFSDDAFWKQDLPANTYDAATTYLVGDRVMFSQAGSDSIYEANQETTGNLPTDVTRWSKIIDLPLQYANGNDVMGWLGSVYSYVIPNFGSTYRFDVLDALNNVVLSKTRTSEKDAELYQMDVSHLPSSKVTIRVVDTATDTTEEETTGIILNAADVHEKPLGLIEIMGVPTSNAYGLIDGTNTFLNPAYELRFKNRATIWQYYNENEILVTSTPELKPLIFRGYQKITHEGVDLPNPEVKMIHPTPQQTYSEIFI